MRTIKKQVEFDIDHVGRIIGSEPASWSGRCYEIACSMLHHNLVEGEPRYGHWVGPIHGKSFFSHRRDHGFCQHGWVECYGGLICDPTRWVFEQALGKTKPYIYIGHDEEGYYDAGGNILRDSMYRPPPISDKNDRVIDFPITTVGVARMGKPPYSKEQIFWLANLSLNKLGKDAIKIYEAIIDMGCSGFIPYDNKLLVLGSHRSGRSNTLNKIPQPLSSVRQDSYDY